MDKGLEKRETENKLYHIYNLGIAIQTNSEDYDIIIELERKLLKLERELGDTRAVFKIMIIITALTFCGFIIAVTFLRGVLN